MNLIFERGDRSAPAGHALIYFTVDGGATLGTYCSVPPIQFDLSSYVPGFLASAMQGLDLGNAMVATAMPPIPEEVPGVEYLRALAERRQDDLVFAGATQRSDPMRLAADAAQAAQAYGELYSASALPEKDAPSPSILRPQRSPYEAMTEQEKLNELTALTGRLRDSLQGGRADMDVERQMRDLAGSLPAKYRATKLLHAVQTPGPAGQRLAELYLERCYKLYNEDYLDLERIDREIDAVGG